MPDKIIDFPPNKQKPRPLVIKDVDTILFQTVDDRRLYITDRDQISKIMRLILAEKFTILEDK